MANSSDLIILYLDKVELVIIGLRDIIRKEPSWLIMFWMSFVRKPVYT